MTAPRAWSEADDALIQRQRAEGRPVKEIAASVGCSVVAVKARLQRLAAGVKQRRMTDEDKARIVELARMGMTGDAIARKTGWHVGSVFDVRKRAGLVGRRARSLDRAQVERVIDMILAGRSAVAIAQAMGCSEDVVRNVAFKAQIKFGRRTPPPVPAEPPAITPPSAEDRWREALAGRRFHDVAPWQLRPLGNRMPRITLETGTGRSSMAYA